MKKLLISILLTILLALLYGCADQHPTPITDVPTALQSDFPDENNVSPNTVGTVPIEPSIPDLALNIEGGSYLLRYSDEYTGDYLDYYVFVPGNAETNMPLVVFLHGDGEIGRPEALENYGIIRKAREMYGDNYPFIAISPCTRVASWTDGTIPDTLKGLIDYATKTYCIDPNRIVITGHSRGAMGVWYMISTYGDFFSAAVPISCGASVQLDFNKCAEVPILAYVGDTGEYEYRFQLAMERIIYCIHEVDGQAELIILDNATHAETHLAYTAETFQWMLEQ